MKLLPTVGALLLAFLAATACTAGGGSGTAPAPTPTPRATASDQGSSATPDPGRRPVVVDQVLGSDGLTVRYQDRDGSTKTLRVEDFPR